MRLLHIYKSEPDENTKILVKILSEGQGVTEYRIYEPEPDYEALIDMVFDHDKVITWW
jgi:hypothetical protein